MDLSLHVGKETIKPVSVVRDLGVLLDEELTMNQHISKTAYTSHFYRASICEGGLGSRNSVRLSICHTRAL